MRRSRSPTTPRTGSEPALDSRRLPCVPHGPRDPGGARVDQLLPPLPGARGVRWLQELRGGPREPPHDARPLLADQVHPGQPRPEASRLLLDGNGLGYARGSPGDRAACAQARPPRLLPVRRLLRWKRGDVPSRGRAAEGPSRLELGTPPGHRSMSIAISSSAGEAGVCHRRFPRCRRGVLPRGPGERPLRQSRSWREEVRGSFPRT